MSIDIKAILLATEGYITIRHPERSFFTVYLHPEISIN